MLALIVGAAVFGLHKVTTTSSGSRSLTTSQIAAKVDPGLVDVVTALGFQNAAAAGTGLVLSSSGEILTNNHVIEGATSIKAVDIGNGRTYRAKVVGYDRGHDVAVLQLVNARGLQTVTLGDSSGAQVGQHVTAIGNAGGKGGTPSVVTGRITALNASVIASDHSAGTTERLTGLIKHNAPIRPGDSGGPLVNSAAQVIGINTAGSNGMQFSTGQSKTQAFSIPINDALTIAHQIEAGKGSASVHIGATGFVGVQVASSSQAASNGVPAGSGALIVGVLPNTPAASTGLAAGDVITSVAGRRVGSPEQLQRALELHHPGDRVAIGWTTKAGAKHTAPLTLASGPAG